MRRCAWSTSEIAEPRRRAFQGHLTVHPLFYTTHKIKTDINYPLPSSRGILSFLEQHPIPCSLLLTTPLLYTCIKEYCDEQKQHDEALDDRTPEAPETANRL